MLSGDRHSDDADALSRWTARLRDPALERAFRDSRADRDIRQVRWATVLAMLFNSGFVFLDYAVIEGNVWLAVGLRLFWGLPATALAIYLTYRPAFAKNLTGYAWFVFILSTGFYLAINLLSETPDVYLSGFIIILIFLQLFMPLSFPATLSIGAICSLIFAIGMALGRDVALSHYATICSQFLATLAAGSFAVYLFNRYRRLEFLANRRVAEQRRQYHALLNRILPESVVARMQAGEDQIADSMAEVTVLFADVVGFTEIAARHRAEDVLASINDLFARFDALVAEHGLEKIKTIGDAYMVAGGVPEASAGHIRAAADLALAMLDVSTDLAGPDGQALRLRIGIHCGPVLAGVVGESRFGYDLWGDTVNVASRMQTSGEPGHIQVSEPVHRALAGAYRLQSRGLVEVKGKGGMTAWYLLGKKQGA